ncbi:low molecular weight phosphatase family protein [Georgenia halophila]|uniref:Low molecular weight phosphatase family protein n=1 Tax=Georgenia halophila TaxID=620889 RepID=A0ABP8KT28_9MICO
MSYGSSSRFTILTVCTGNICRSPAAERLFRSAFGTNGDVAVGSAGIGALVGEPIHGPMANLLRDIEVDTEDFAARMLTEDLVRNADLILGMTREHRAAVVELAPAAVKRTFTIREFARLAAEVDRDELEANAGPDPTPGSRLAALVPLAAQHRAAVEAELDDVVDPFRRRDKVYRQSFDQILPTARTIARIALNL